MPGNVNYKTCIKYSEFNQERTFSTNGTTDRGNLCTRGAPNLAIDNKHLSPYYPQSVWGQMCWLSAANMIEAKVVCRGNASGAGWLTNPYFDNISEGQRYADYRVDGLHYFAQASFDTIAQIGFHGFDSLDKWERDYKYNFRFFNMNPNDDYETNNLNFRQSVHRHNTLFLLNSNLGCPCKSVTRNCSCKSSVGAISARMAGKLDAKIDDGRPGSGKLLAYKNDYDHQDTKPSTSEIEQVCYNASINNVSSAIYESSTNLRYGCNLLKVMDDVK